MSGDVYDIDCVVIGAGVVGLACAAELARRGREVLVAEAASGIGAGISSRNSEVIHAGLYYPTGSLKHRLCVSGRRKLYDYAASRGVPHRKIGKLVVATNAAEESQIAAIHARAIANDVEHVAMLSGPEARALEPNLSCVSALISRETGLVDSHGLMLALRGDLEDRGGSVVLETPLLRGDKSGGGYTVHFGGASPMTLTARCVINAAGLSAPRIAKALGADAPEMTLAKGSYFGCTGKPAFSHLIYPAPVDGGLGVHLTIDLGGRMRFGPDVEWLDETDPAKVDYAVDPKRADSFYAAIRRYWPALPDGALTPDYSGCRPKLSRHGEPTADFRIDANEGLVNLFGIESPGLTSSLAIADTAADSVA